MTKYRTDEHDQIRFWLKVNKNGPIKRPDLGPCWVWTAGKNDFGYGVFWVKGKSHNAHRVSAEWAGIVIPVGLIVRHKCDNPSCVNWEHLEPGTYKQNSNDARVRGRTATGDRNGARLYPERMVHFSGEDNPIAVLNAAKVIAMRQAYAAGGVTYRQLGKQYGVHGTTVFYVVKRRIWTHVE